MVERKEKDELIEIGVVVQFCLLSVLKKQKITIKNKTKTTQTRKKTRRQQQILDNARHTPRDKLIKGFGVSLAKCFFMIPQRQARKKKNQMGHQFSKILHQFLPQ